MAIVRMSALALICASHALAQGNSTKWPEVVGVLAVPGSLVEHHTDKYRMDDGFVIRRGRSFELTVTTDEALENEDQTIIMQNDDKPGKAFPKWEAKLKQKLGGKQYLIEVTTAVDSPVGKYENIAFLVVTKDQKGGYKHTHEAYEYSYPFPIYLLFDAWNPEDKDVFVADDAIRKDTLMNEYGKVFDGSLNDHRVIHWYYGHFHQVALDGAFHILQKADPKIMHDAYEVAKFLCHNEGVVEAGGGKLSGNKDGLLYGRWESTFPDGKDPDSWVSTYDILKIWKDTGAPTKYGQCWVFAAVQNTLLRTLGYASRQLSCFGARIDQSNKDDPNNVKHHVVREYYDKSAKLQYSYGSVWNYHSWNDVYLNRDDKEYSGWQGIDATPPGLGVGSVKAVFQQRDKYPWATDELVSTTHSRVERYLVECEPLEEGKKRRTSLDGCEVQKLVSVDKKGVQQMLSSAEDASGEKDITGEYVDPTRDAYVPEQHHPHHHLQKEEEEEETPYHIRIQPHAHRVTVGTAVDLLVAVDYHAAADGSPALDVAVSLDLVDNEGNVLREVQSNTGRMVIDSEGHGEIAFKVSPSEYVHINMRDTFLEVRALVTDPATGHVTMEKHSVVMAGPKMHVMSPPVVAANGEDLHEIRMHVQNPHDFAVEKLCVKAHTGHAMRLHGDHTQCVSLAANEAATIVQQVFSPEEEGSHLVTLTMLGDYMPETIHHVTIAATEPRTRMNSFLN